MTRIGKMPMKLALFSLDSNFTGYDVIGEEREKKREKERNSEKKKEANETEVNEHYSKIHFLCLSEMFTICHITWYVTKYSFLPFPRTFLPSIS